MMHLRLLACGSMCMVLISGGMGLTTASQGPAGPSSAPSTPDPYPLLTPEAFDRMFHEVKNWGRWGEDDQRGTYNLITPEKRKQAAGLVKDGISVSLQHTVIEEKAVDVRAPLQKLNHGNKLIYESVHGGAYHSHIDALCHMAYKGQVYNGFWQKDIVTERGCRKLDIAVYKDGFVTRGVLIDMARFKGVPWLEPGTPVTLQDLEAWQEKTGIEVLAGDAVFLRTGKWARRAKLGPWPIVPREGPHAGWHWSVIPWFRAHDVAIIGGEGPNDVEPRHVEKAAGDLLPIHIAAMAGLGAIVLDGMDVEAVAEQAAKLNRWEFMMTAAPPAIAGGTGMTLNVTATF